MATIESSISTGGAAFQSNRAGMLALLERVRGCMRRAVAASEASRPRFEQRGQLLPRERVALLLDPGAPFLELCALAGLGLDNADVDELQRQIIERFESQMSVFATSARLLDDGVIDPLDTRAVLCMVLSICREASAREPQAMQFSVARP